MREGVERFLDLSDPSESLILGSSNPASAREAVRTGDVATLAATPGHFQLAGRDGKTVRLARTLAGSLRYLVLKDEDGPFLVASERIDRIGAWCRDRGILDQFNPAYTRMIPAHYLVEIDQVGCPDPNPRYTRFFTPPAEKLPADVDEIGPRYVGAMMDGLRSWFRSIPRGEPVGIAFSGGIDSSSVLLAAVRVLEERGEGSDRLTAYTLSVDAGADLAQAREVARRLGLAGNWEAVEVPALTVGIEEAVAVTEDYHPLDVACAAAGLALLGEVRRRRPELKYWLDGDGGDENLKSYPLEDSELTMQSILRTPLLYQEGWGVDAIKHSITYSGGLSRGVVRGYSTASRYGFRAFSPYTLRPVVALAEAIPFRELTGGRAEVLYGLKGRVVGAGILAHTGRELPICPKRRFQDGAMGAGSGLRPSEAECRRAFARLYPAFEMPRSLELAAV